MEYVQPYGISDINGSYINGNSRLGQQGSIPPAEAFEWPMRELVALIQYSGITPSADDLEQITKAVRSQRINFAVDTGSANAMSVAYDPAFVALSNGLILRVLVAHDNTDETTITVNNLPAVAVVRANGAELSAGDVVAGQVVTLVYDGTNFQIVNYYGYSVGSTTSNFYEIGIPYCVDTSVTPNSIVAPFNPAITSIAPGDLIEVQIANSNNGPVTINVNSLPVKNVKLGDLTALEANMVVVGMIAVFVYDGTQWQLLNPARAKSITGGSGQIAGRYMYQDPNYHITSVYNSYVEAFRVAYEPVDAGNTIRLQVVGSFNSAETTEMPIGRGINGYLAYSTDDGVTWNPPSWPGRDYRSVGTFKANPAMSEIIEGFVATAGINRIDFNFTIVGEMVVPAGPPATVIFKLMFASAYVGNLTTMVHGGTIMEITEYFPIGA